MTIIEKQACADWLRTLEDEKLRALGAQLGVADWRTLKRKTLRLRLVNCQGVNEVRQQATR